MKPLTRNALERAGAAFAFEGTIQDTKSNESGHINDTVEVKTVDAAGSAHHYILQRINTDVFVNPKELMENICRVTSFMKEKIEAEGGDPLRETLTVVPTKDGASCYLDEDGNAFRAYLFIENAVCYDTPTHTALFRASGLAFGHFLDLLSDYPAKELHETIPNFHNTAKRYADFLEAQERDAAGRKKEVEEEIAFLKRRAFYAHAFDEALTEGNLPLRVTHNDAKLSNVMFDKTTGKALCVIDLDTIMPGLSVLDFGDAIRFGASTAAEDEPDLTKVRLDLDRYHAFLEGYLAGCAGKLTKPEEDFLPLGAKVITFEQALRFLGDYLNGDVYYHTERPGQNLDRTRTQIRLLEQMEKLL